MQFGWSKKRSTVAVILIILFAGIFIGIKVYTKPNNAIKSANKTNAAVSASNTPAASQNAQNTYAPDALVNESGKAQNETTAPSVNEQASKVTQSGNSEAASNEAVKQKGSESSSAPVQEEKSSMPGAVQDKANGLISKSVSNDDYFKAASTILGKLSFSEMKYIFDSARDDFWITTSVDEINRIRNMLFAKLSDDDINTLAELGKKYGRSMTILRKDIDVAKTKEAETARRKALNK